VIGYILSIIACLGAVTLIFQNGHFDSLPGTAKAGPILSFLPVLLIGVLFGLAMDYEVFLVSRMREEHTHGAKPRQAIIDGNTGSAKVVGSAGIIMIAVFAAFILARPDNQILRRQPRPRRPDRRLRSTNDPRPRRHVPIQKQRLVAPPPLGSSTTQHRRRRRPAPSAKTRRRRQRYLLTQTEAPQPMSPAAARQRPDTPLNAQDKPRDPNRGSL
jgi:hypothetical protein